MDLKGKTYKAIVLGLSSGGMDAMKFIFSALPSDFRIPIIVVQHMSAHSDSQWIPIVSKNFKLPFKEADEKEPILEGHIYIAPPNYHLLVENDFTLSLSIDEKVSYARPSIDVLFETAAFTYKEKLVGIIMTGSNHDGSAGLLAVKNGGGLCVVQDPETAASPFMPRNAITKVNPHFVLSIKKIIDLLKELRFED